MNYNGKKLHKKLESELRKVAFSTSQKTELVDFLIENRKKESLIQKVVHALLEFWNGTCEVPLYLGVIGLLFLVIGVRNTLDIFLVDNSAALLLLEQGIETIERMDLL